MSGLAQLSQAVVEVLSVRPMPHASATQMVVEVLSTQPPIVNAPAEPIMFVVTMMRAKHLYWRLNIAKSGGYTTNFAQIAELSLRPYVGGSQQAIGGTASASATYMGSTGTSTNYLPANAFDGNPATYWSANTGACVLEYQFASPVAVDEYAITGVTSSAASQSPSDWTLEWSDDGTTWTAVDSHSNLTTWADGETKVFKVSNPS